MINNFNFYDNSIAVSFQSPKGKKQIKSDFAMEGDSNYLINGLIEQMERHKELAIVITSAAYNYMVRNGKPE